jgi:hypothetical protein
MRIRVADADWLLRRSKSKKAKRGKKEQKAKLKKKLDSNRVHACGRVSEEK